MADAVFLYSLLLASWGLRRLFVRVGMLNAPILEWGYINQHYLILIALSLLVFASQSLYFSRSNTFNEYKKIVKSALILFLLWGLFVFVLKLGAVYSRIISLGYFVLMMGLLPYFRKRLKSILFRLGLWRKQVLIIGDCYPSRLRTILTDRILGYEARYFHADTTREVMKILEGVDSAESMDLLLVFEGIRVHELESLIKKVEFDFETIKIFSSFSRLMEYVFLVETHLPFNFFVIKRNLLKPHNRVMKRLLDLLLSCFLLALFSPVILLAGLVLLVVNRGKVFYVQERVGYQGKPFKLIKFRTMFWDADQILSAHLAANPERRKEWEMYRKFRRNDPRVTRVGRMLRKWSLDELPQLFNVVRGEMSVIGPRPYLSHEFKCPKSEMGILFYAKPGLTGLWQIMGRNELDFKNRILIDEYYIRNWDFWLDLFILMRTPISMMKGY